MDFCKSNPAELAALFNAFASIMADGKSHEEIEIMAFAFDMLSDTLFSIARIQKHKERLCRRDDAE
jgi:hypothetical protein